MQVSAVCLSDLGLCKLAHLDQLPSLRWLSLANNALASLEVDSCNHWLECAQLELLYIYLPGSPTVFQLGRVDTR